MSILLDSFDNLDSDVDPGVNGKIYSKLDYYVQQRQGNLQIGQKDDLVAFTTTCEEYNPQTQDRCLFLTHPDYMEDYADIWRPSKRHTKYQLDLEDPPSVYARRLVCFLHTEYYTQAAGPCTIREHVNSPQSSQP